MDRRTTLGLLAAGALFGPVSARAQTVAAPSIQPSATGTRVLGERYSTAYYGLREGGDGLPALRTALSETPAGASLTVEPGTYQCYPQGRGGAALTLSRNIHILGAGDRGYCRIRIMTQDSGAQTDGLHVAISENGGRGDVRGWVMTGVSIGFDRKAGRHALRVADGLPMNGTRIFGNGLSGGRNGSAIHVEHDNFVYATIEHNDIDEGIHLATADGNRVERNVIYGEKCGVTIDAVPGAYETIVSRNAIVSRDGAVRVENGSLVTISENQIEHALYHKARNQAAIPASIVLLGGRYEGFGCRIIGNNLGGGTNVDLGIHIGRQRRCRIDANRINAHAETDIVLTPDAVETIIGDNVSTGSPADPRPGGLLISDQGKATMGSTRSAAQLGYQRSGWSGGDFFMNADRVVRFVTPFEGGESGRGAVMGILPEGYRPAIEQPLPVATDNGPGTIRIRPDGIILADTLPSNRGVGLGVTFVAEQRVSGK